MALLSTAINRVVCAQEVVQEQSELDTEHTKLMEDAKQMLLRGA